MPKKMDKRGMDLTLNTIIIAVLVVLVLVLVATFFLGGFKGLTDRIKAIFFTTTAGVDEVLAVEICRQYCDQAEVLPATLQENSAYCKQAFVIDGKSILNREGKYDNAYQCGPSSSPIPENFKNINSITLNLNVPCNIKCSQTP